jgi:drug/metabolite transporter (DMT)-like permease
MLQKLLSAEVLSATGATFARFCYSAPFILVVLAGYVFVTGRGSVALGAGFWAFAAGGAIAQVVATVALVTLFKLRNFAVGVTLMKTEVILSVIVGFVLLGDGIGLWALVAIAVGLVGVLLLSPPPDAKAFGATHILGRTVGLGVGAGLLFSVSAVCYRGASLEIASQDAVLRAGVTLAAVTSMQMIGMWMWLQWRDPAQIGLVWRARRTAIWIGITSLGGSFCWFYAFTLQAAALVKAVGQVELVLSLLASVLFFGERISRREVLGMAVLGASILLLVLVG